MNINTYQSFSKQRKILYLLFNQDTSPKNPLSCWVTVILIPSLTKFGQNVFATETKPFSHWLESLTENALYKAFLNANSAANPQAM